MAFTPHIERFRISNYDVDQAGRLKFRSLMGFLQEAAGNHAVKLGVGFEELDEQGLAWVLAHMGMTLHRMPMFGTEVTVETWPSSSNKYYAFRRFRVMDGEGNMATEAVSVWVILDVVRRRMKAMSKEVRALRANGFEPDTPPDPNPPKIPTLDGYPHATTLTSRRDDLDRNGHVNNTVLMQWLLEAVPDQVHESMQLKSAEISFRAECLLRETVTSHCAPSPDKANTFLHTIVRQGDGKELIRAETRFE